MSGLTLNLAGAARSGNLNGSAPVSNVMKDGSGSKILMFVTIDAV
jgi:hypothetical protein